MIFALITALALMPSVVQSAAAHRGSRTVIYDGVVHRLGPAPKALDATSDLWGTLSDLKRVTGFVIKPQGICRDELCFPIPRGRRQAFLSRRGSRTWFNLSEFARLVRQPVAHDEELATWFFGPRADEQNGHISSLTAPDFTLPDINGKPHSLTDFRGSKVLLLTWASW